MKAFIMPNLDKKNAELCTNEVISKLLEYGIMPIIDMEQSDIFKNSGANFLVFNDAIRQTDIVIAIGGDGTLIHSAKHAVRHEKPLLGINVGRLGFMAGLEIPELSRLKRLVTGEYLLEKRMMLNCLHYSNGQSQQYLALNDIVVSNGALSRIIELDLSCNEGYLTTYRADGLIFSTPTGSTAYALSAGGPVIEPCINCISITPICSHTLNAKTVIFSDEKVLKVCMSERNLHPVYVTIDGDQGASLNQGDYLEVSKSKKSVKLINLSDKTFYEVLNYKFNLMETKGGANL